MQFCGLGNCGGSETHLEAIYDQDIVRPELHIGYYTPPGWDLYCSPCRLYGPTYRSPPIIPLEEGQTRRLSK